MTDNLFSELISYLCVLGLLFQFLLFLQYVQEANLQF